MLKNRIKFPLFLIFRTSHELHLSFVCLFCADFEFTCIFCFTFQHQKKSHFISFLKYSYIFSKILQNYHVYLEKTITFFFLCPYRNYSIEMTVFASHVNTDIIPIISILLIIDQKMAICVPMFTLMLVIAT